MIEIPGGWSSNLVGEPQRSKTALDDHVALRQSPIMSFASHYEAVIAWIVLHCGGSDKFAHTYAGLLIWLLSVLIAGRSNARFELGLAAIILIEIANECIDRIAHGSWMLRDTLGDAAATWFWPTILTVAIRWHPPVFQRPRGQERR